MAIFTPGLTVREHHIVQKTRQLPLEGDVTWSETVWVTGDVTIPAGSSLTVEMNPREAARTSAETPSAGAARGITRRSRLEPTTPIITAIRRVSAA